MQGKREVKTGGGDGGGFLLKVYLKQKGGKKLTGRLMPMNLKKKKVRSYSQEGKEGGASRHPVLGPKKKKDT